MLDSITIRGAREHNLANIDVTIPRNQLVVITGVSGSGKSSLAFDTLFAEGQRRYVESLSAYARQFLDQMEKPDVDTIDGLSPAISIEQKTTSKNPRSTVGTVTEVHDYLRLLWASIGVPHCPDCTVADPSPDGRADGRPAARAARRELGSCCSLRWSRRARASTASCSSRWCGRDSCGPGSTVRWSTSPIRRRSTRSASTRSRWSSTGWWCARACRRGSRTRWRPPSESVRGWCGSRSQAATRSCCPRATPVRGAASRSPRCRRGCSRSTRLRAPARSAPGWASLREVDPEKLVLDPERSLAAGCLATVGHGTASWFRHQIEQLASHLGFDLHTPWRRLPDDVRRLIMYGSDRELDWVWEGRKGAYRYRDRFEGVVPRLERRSGGDLVGGRPRRARALPVVRAVPRLRRGATAP